MYGATLRTNAQGLMASIATCMGVLGDQAYAGMVASSE
jgi:hypothetical protein